jgi:hypothetical protein
MLFYGTIVPSFLRVHIRQGDACPRLGPGAFNLMPPEKLPLLPKPITLLPKSSVKLPV